MNENFIDEKIFLIIKKSNKIYYKFLKLKNLYNLFFLLNKNFEKNKLLLEENFERNKSFKNNIFYSDFEKYYFSENYIIIDFDSNIIITSVLKQNLEENYKKFFKNFEVLRVY